MADEEGSVKGNQVQPIAGEPSSGKVNRLPPMAVGPAPETDKCEPVLKADESEANPDNRVVNEKFRAGVKKATAFAELQRRHSVEDWQTVPNDVKFMTHPEHPTKTKWDLTLAAMILYSVTTVPWRIAFNVDATGAWLALDSVVDVFFFFDILVSFRTGYMDPDGRMEWRSGKVAWHYGCGPWFVIDFLSTVPIDHLVTAATSDGPSGLRLVKLVRLVRLVRLAKLMKLINFDDFLEGHDFLDQNRGLVSILAMLLQISFIAHLMGCVWYNAAVQETEPVLVYKEPSWITARYPCPPDPPKGACIADGSALALPVWTKYTASIYWAVTTMATVGYGDINTSNDIERGFAVFAMIIGASAFGYTIGIISDLIQNSNVEKVRKREKMNRLLHYCISVDLPYWLKKRLKKQWEFDCLKRGVFDETEMLQYMPLQVQDFCVKKGKYLQLTKQIPILFGSRSYCDLSYTVAVMKRLRFVLVKGGDVIFEQCSVGWHTYFVCQGEVRIEIDVGKKQNGITADEPDTSSEAALTTGPMDMRKMVPVRVKDSEGRWTDWLIRSNEVFGQNFTLPGDGSVAQYKAVANDARNELCSLTREALAELAELWPDLVDEFERGQEAIVKTIQIFKQANSAGQDPSAQDEAEESGKAAEHNADDMSKQMSAKESDLEKGIFHNPSQQELWKNGILYPEADWKVNWDLFVGACIVISVVVEPYRLGFDVESEGAGVVIDAIIDAAFWMDMILSFRTAFFTEQRQLIYDSHAVFWHYLKGWFMIDFITTLPVDRIAGGFIQDPQDLRVVKVLRVLRLFRLAKLAKIMQNGPLFEKFEDMTQGINQSFFNLCFLIIILLMAAHLIGCTWHFVAAGDGSWVSDYWSAQATDIDSLDFIPVWTRYLTSFYWALATMTTVGYGDVSAHKMSEIEMVVAMASMLIGTTTFAYIIGELVLAVLNYDPAEKERKIKKRSLKKFLEERNLPGSMVERARKGLKYASDFSSIFESKGLLADMPEHLLRMLVDFKYEPTIQRFSLFQVLEKQFPGCCSLMMPLLQPLVAERGVWLFQVGSKISAAYFIQKGCCRLHCPDQVWAQNAIAKTTDSKPPALTAIEAPNKESDEKPSESLTYKAGDICAEPTLFVPVGARFRLRVGVKAVDTCNLLILGRKDFFKIQEICPTLFTNLRLRWKTKQSVNQWVD